jgi:hypothetical protein
VTKQVNHCGSCKHLNLSEEFPAHNKLGLFRCSDAKDRALFVFANKETDCEAYESVANLGDRRKVLRIRKNG